jgi:hypothetical protein
MRFSLGRGVGVRVIKRKLVVVVQEGRGRDIGHAVEFIESDGLVVVVIFSAGGGGVVGQAKHGEPLVFTNERDYAPETGKER